MSLNKANCECLVYAISPAHLISSISAIQSLHGNDPVKITVIVCWPFIKDETNQEIFLVIKEMSKQIPFIERIIALSNTQISQILALDNAQSIVKAVKNEINILVADEIYYSHDVTGVLYQLLSMTYPQAVRICFGEPLGSVFEKNVHLSYYSSPIKESKSSISFKSQVSKAVFNVLRKCKTFIARSLVRAPKAHSQYKVDVTNMHFQPHRAALILPVDQSGNFLKNVELTICRKNIVNNVVSSCAASSMSLKEYIQTTLASYLEKNKILVLTENFAEGNFISFDREIEMWCTVIKENCKEGDVIFLKSHPGETLPRNEKIKEKLSGTFEVIELDKKFNRYPIEIWEEFVLCTKVICMSYPIVSLKYLYNVDVIQPMNHLFIEKWFPEWTWASYKNSLSLYMEPLRRLPSWDGKSVLWSGSWQNKKGDGE